MGFILALWEKLNSTIRYKLLVLVLFPIVVVAPFLFATAIYWGEHLTYEQLYIKVNTDLSVSQNFFKRLQGDYLQQIARFAESYTFHQSVLTDNQTAIQQQLHDFKQSSGLSYLNYVTPSHFNTLKPSPLLNQVQQGASGSGIEIFSHTELEAIDTSLSKAVNLTLIDTPRARVSQRQKEDRGMMIRAMYPVKNAQQHIIAILDAGVLLNGNFAVVDSIRDLVYGEGSLPKGSLGTVTIFLDDVRISTNVPLKAGERALGTRVSEVVHRQVMDQGDNWIKRAFVVNDWYISGYTPIINTQGKRIGILYAGFLEKPFRGQLFQTLLLLSGLFLLLFIATILLTIHGAHSIFKPLERISRVIRAIRKGKDERVGHISVKDEIGELAHELDVMLDRLYQQRQDIEQGAEQLENKVIRRTAELVTKNEDLETTITVLHQTQRKLVMAEKLAAMGELTAGVAHEINNPVAVISGNTEIISLVLGDKADVVQQEIDLIIEQVERIQEIINNLLQYARPDQFSREVQLIDVNDLLAKTFKLIKHLAKHKHFKIKQSLQATMLIRHNPHELQQVIINLIRNAIYAIPPDGGWIEVTTKDTEQGIKLTIRDNGTGIAEQHLDQIFDPFFTTKQKQGEEGTGLGLSLSYGLIQRYGGDIRVVSPTNSGAEFSVYLLKRPILNSECIHSQTQPSQ